MADEIELRQADPEAAAGSDEQSLRRKLFWMIVIRALIITTLFGSLLLVQFIGNELISIAPLYYMLAAVYPLTLLYYFCYRRLGNPRAQAYLQIVGDMLFLTGLVYFSGGLVSPFYFLYIIPIIAASITLYRKGSLIIAALSGILYGVLVDLMYYGVIPFYSAQQAPPPAVSLGVVYYNVFSSLFGFFAAALLSSYLSESLKRTGAQLEVKLGDLADLQAIHRDIVDNMASGLLSTDLRATITTINPAGAKILRCDEADLRGKDLATILGVPPGFFDRLYPDLLEKRVVRFEREVARGDGGRLIVGVAASLLRARGGEPVGFVFNFLDLTDVRRLEQEVRIKDRLAAVGEMAAGIAHEIRNPLASISGSLQVLGEELELTAEQQYLMEIVMRESGRLDKTIDDFLEFARPSQVVMEEIDLVELARETVSLLNNSHELTDAHHVVLKAAAGAPFVADRRQWAQVFWNIMKNAIKAMPVGGTLTIEIARPDGGTGYALSFRDTGVGMSESEAQRVGQPFFSGFQRGTGLGMAIVQRIVKDYDGKLSVRSRKGEGTEIEILLAREVEPVV
ncbi:MAG: ATP-binding protein [Acidobacteriota bacterium]